MLRSTRIIVLLADVLFGPAVPSALACSTVCVSGRKLSDSEWEAALRQEYDVSRIAFLGRVVSVEPQTGTDLPPEYANKVATLEVVAEWKGHKSATYQMTTACCGASCGYPFKVGQIHLLLLGHDGEWMSSTGCAGPTKEELRDTVRMLDRVTKSKKTPLPPELK